MKILFVHSCMPTFARTDYDILSEAHEVREFDFPSIHNGIINVAKCLPALLRGVYWSDITFSWFGKLHAFFAVFFSRILGKKSAVVVSGGEVCNFSFQEIDYRSICSQPFKRWFPRYVSRHADLLLPVSSYVYTEAVKNAHANQKKMKLIYHGFDTNRYHPLPEVKKQKIVITISELRSTSPYHKGLFEFLLAASHVPEILFLLVGPDLDGTAKKLKMQLPRNAKITGGLYGRDLIEVLSSASVYVQASRWESFGCSVAEAMACECVPVVTRIPALEEVVGDCGIYLDEPVTPKDIATKVRLALKRLELGKRARQRVIENFSLVGRSKKLLEVVNSLDKDKH